MDKDIVLLPDGTPFRSEPGKSRPIVLDRNAESADPNLPAFLARPADAPIYHGFMLLTDEEVDGFMFGTITDFEAEPGIEYGDAFVVAPDNSRAGLVWEIYEPDYFQEVCPIEQNRWGVWGVTFPFPMQTRADARRNLEYSLPRLKEKWQIWRDQYASDK